MWLVSNPPCRHTLVGSAGAVSGVPTAQVLVQLANAHCEFGITSFVSCWWTRRVSVAVELSVLAAAYAGGALTFTKEAGAPKMYSPRTFPVIVDPSGFFATGMVIRIPELMSFSQ